jgi:hypothetical protein
MRCRIDGWLENKNCLALCDCHHDPQNMQNVQNAWDDGFRARIRGQAVAGNPHKLGSREWKLWRDGWLDADEHQQAKAICFPDW